MDKKIAQVLVTLLFLIIVVLNSSITLAQSPSWDWVELSAYWNNFVEGDPVPEAFRFNIVTPPTGSEITNTIYVMNNDGENYTKILSPGDLISLVHLDCYFDERRFDPATEEGHYIINYEGEASNLTLDGSYIPEFSSIILVPLFIIITLLATIYKRKRPKK